MAEEATPVSEIMTTPVRTIHGEASVTQAARVLTDEGIGSLVVGRDVVEGIVTEADVVRAAAEERALTATSVREVMSEPVVTARPHESVKDAGRRMAQNTVKKLPVTDDGQAVGIVTTTDLARYYS